MWSWKLPQEGWGGNGVVGGQRCVIPGISQLCVEHDWECPVDLLGQCTPKCIPSSAPPFLHAPAERLVLCLDTVRNLTMAVSSNTTKIRLFIYLIKKKKSFLLYMLWLSNTGLESAWRFCDAVLSLELRIKVQAAFIQALGWRSKRQSWLRWNKKIIPFEYQNHTWFISGLFFFWESLVCFWLLFLLL